MLLFAFIITNNLVFYIIFSISLFSESIFLSSALNGPSSQFQSLNAVKMNNNGREIHSQLPHVQWMFKDSRKEKNKINKKTHICVE